MSRSNDVPSDVGQHCSLLDCKTLDFLPFTCPHCARVHCREHAAPDLHACEKASSSDNIAQDGGSRFTDKFNDLLPDAKRRALDRDGVERNKQQKRLDAREVLARNFGQAAVARLDRTTNSIPSTPIKAQGKAPSPVIMLMKLKQRAIPVDAKAKSLSIEDRLYLSVQHRCGVEHELKSERAVWISKVSPGLLDPLSRCAADQKNLYTRCVR